MIGIQISWSWGYNMDKIGTRLIVWLSGHLIGQKFLSAPKSAFFPTRSPAPLFIFFDNGLAKKMFFFCLRYEHMYLENIPLKWCYFVIWLKMEKNPQLRFPKNEILIKKHFGHFLLLFFSIFFPKIVKKERSLIWPQMAKIIEFC